MSTPCPLCDRPPIREYAPFCSRGCKDRDLLRWLEEGYRIPHADLAETGGSGGLDKPFDAD